MDAQFIKKHTLLSLLISTILAGSAISSYAQDLPYSLPPGYPQLPTTTKNQNQEVIPPSTPNNQTPEAKITPTPAAAMAETNEKVENISEAEPTITSDCEKDQEKISSQIDDIKKQNANLQEQINHQKTCNTQIKSLQEELDQAQNKKEQLIKHLQTIQPKTKQKAE